MVLHTFSVVAEAHLRLAETNGVFALANSIEFLELCLVHALHKQVSIECLNGCQQLVNPAKCFWCLQSIYSRLSGASAQIA